MQVKVKDIQKYIQGSWVGWVITFGAIVIVSLAHWIGVFDSIELKTYDYRLTPFGDP